MRTAIPFLVAFASCAAQPATVRLRLDYEASWGVDSFNCEGLNAPIHFAAVTNGQSQREVLLVATPETVGSSLLLRCVALSSSQQPLARAEATVVPQANAEVLATMVFIRTDCSSTCMIGEHRCEGSNLASCTRNDAGCPEWTVSACASACSGGACSEACINPCPVGATRCEVGGVSNCVVNDEGCPIWGPATPCAIGTCSLGTCSESCVDECAQWEARCASPSGLELCGQADSDACLDWQPAQNCPTGMVCSFGNCAPSCADECIPGHVRCRDGGVAECHDSNADGCMEWSSATPCSTGETCQGQVGRPGESETADCVANTDCMDECGLGYSCTESEQIRCGQFDFDRCLDRSYGSPCATSDPCIEGSCSATLGCVRSRRRCETPPDPTCVTPTTLRVYNGFGSCNSGVGDCFYSHRDVSCRSCPGDCDALCDASACAQHPAPGTPDEACWVAGSGTCSNGVCTYQTREGSCNDGDACTAGDQCDNGVCQPGRLISCDAGRAPNCIDGVARTYQTYGRCSSSGCLYPVQSEETCALGCAGGACAVGDREPTQLSLGTSHSCAVLSDGSVWCWGRGDLCGGAGGSVAQTRPARALGLSNVTALVSGQLHTCALRSDGRLLCWGIGAVVGTGDIFVPVTRPTLLDLTDVRSIAAGPSHSCAVKVDGTVWCWGRGEFGKLGDGQVEVHEVPRPQQVEGLNNTVELALGSDHSCALRNDGTVWCWGDNRSFQTTHIETTVARTPAPIAGLSQVRSISAGGYTSCAINAAAQLLCWGSAEIGRNGNGDAGSGAVFRTPTEIAAVAGLQRVTVGSERLCALRSGALLCWGQAWYGSLGDGNVERHVVAIPALVPGLTAVSAFALGQYHSCAIHNHDVYCWGSGVLGQVGDERGEAHSVGSPFLVENLR